MFLQVCFSAILNFKKPFYLTDQLVDVVQQVFRLVDRLHRSDLNLERVPADREAFRHFGVRRSVLQARRDLKFILI